MNKKALDQYVNFMDQRDELVRRHEEAVRGHDKIKLLIDTLDKRKNEAIERTFKASLAELCAAACLGAQNPDQLPIHAVPPRSALPGVWTSRQAAEPPSCAGCRQELQGDLC